MVIDGHAYPAAAALPDGDFFIHDRGWFQGPAVPRVLPLEIGELGPPSGDAGASQESSNQRSQPQNEGNQRNAQREQHTESHDSKRLGDLLELVGHLFGELGL